MAREYLTGVGVYVQNLASQLTELGVSPRFVMKASRWSKKPLVCQSLPPKSSIHSHFAGLGIRSVLHCPDYYVPVFNRARTVVTIHDLVTFVPHLCDKNVSEKGQKEVRSYLSRNVEQIITPTLFVADQVVHYFPEMSERVHPIFHGADHIISGPRDANECFQQAATQNLFQLRPGLDRPFFLYLGTLERRKNIINIVRSFEIVADKFPDFLLVLAGGSGFDFAAQWKQIVESRHVQKIKYLDFVKDQERQELLKRAYAMIYPSLYEGFGLPIVEGFAAKIPVITSQVGAMAEVAGDAGLLVDPERPESIALAMEKVIESNTLRDELIDRGTRRVSQMSWKKCAKATLEVYKLCSEMSR